MVAKSVQGLLDDIRLLGYEQLALVEQVRAEVKSSFPQVVEEVKYGGILFASGQPFCGVFAYKKHVSVEFIQGAQIDDQLGHLQGSGKGRRHIKLYALADIETQRLDYYLPLAWAAANPGSH